MHTVGEYLTESKILGSNGKNAKKLTVKLWAKGVVDKNTIFDGSEHTQYYIRKSGQLMYGKLDFLNCAFGIVPPELDSYESTLDSPAFDISNINSNFILNRIIQKNFYKKNGDIANGSRKAKRIHPDVFLAMELYVPSIYEQNKISCLLELIDKKIRLQHQLIENLKLYKRGLISSLFNHKLLIGENCKLVKLGEIFNERSERANGDEELLAVTIKNGVQKRNELELKDNSSENKNNYKKVHINDIAYNTMRMWQGASGVSFYNGIVSPAYTVIYLKDNKNNDINFWQYYFKETYLINEFGKHSQGLTSDTWNLKFYQFSEVKVKIPSVKMQNKISAVLIKFDDVINRNEKYLYCLNKTKKHLLQQMFI